MRVMSSGLLLILPYFETEFVVKTDACEEGVGGCTNAQGESNSLLEQGLG